MRLLISNANQFKVKQDLMWVGILTFVTALVWITYSIYLAYNTSTIDSEVSALLDPLNPTLDQETLSQVSNRFKPPEDFLILVRQESEGTSSIVPLGENTEVEQASASAININSVTEVNFDPFIEDDLASDSATELPF